MKRLGAFTLIVLLLVSCAPQQPTSSGPVAVPAPSSAPFDPSWDTPPARQDNPSPIVWDSPRDTVVPSTSAKPNIHDSVSSPNNTPTVSDMNTCLRDVRRERRVQSEAIVRLGQEGDQNKRTYNILRFRKGLDSDNFQCQACVDKVRKISDEIKVRQTTVSQLDQVDKQLVEAIHQVETSAVLNIDTSAVVERARKLLSQQEFDALVKEGPPTIKWDKTNPDSFMKLN